MPVPPRPVTPAKALVASLLATLVLVLGLLAHLPDLHARLHSPHADQTCRHDGSPPAADRHDDSACVVTLFSQGLPAPAGPALIEAPALRHAFDLAARPTAPLPSAPASLHPPALGPPQPRC